MMTKNFEYNSLQIDKTGGPPMISFIRGTVADLTENSAIIELNCIGFEINMTGNALAQLHIGQEVKLHTYFQVREEQCSL